jgi:hypothetical protein
MMKTSKLSIKMVKRGPRISIFMDLGKCRIKDSLKWNHMIQYYVPNGCSRNKIYCKVNKLEIILLSKIIARIEIIKMVPS